MIELAEDKAIEIFSKLEKRLEEILAKKEAHMKEWREKYSGNHSAEINADYNDFNKEYDDINETMSFVTSIIKDIEKLLQIKNQRGNLIETHPHDYEDTLMSCGVEFAQLNKEIWRLSQAILDKNEKVTA